MSLIPSESYSFPDHFTTTVTPSRKPKEQKIEAVRVEKPRAKPRIVALPDPPPPVEIEPEISEIISEEEPLAEEMPPELEGPAPLPVMPVHAKPAPPNPALRRASAPPPRIAEAPPRKMAMPVLKPKVRWNRAAAIESAPAQNNGNGAHDAVVESAPAQNVIPIPPQKVQARPPAPPPAAARPMPHPVQAPAPKPRPVPMRPAQQPVLPPKPRPAPVSNSQADFFEMFAESGLGAAMNRRRQMKFRRFVAFEAAALAVLLPLVILGFTLDVTAPGVRWIMNIFTIAAAVAAAVIPIVFYALTPTLPDLER